MLKATLLQASGKKIVFLGITGENVARLVNQEEIIFKLNEYLPELKTEVSVAIFYGKTDEELTNTLKKLVPGFPSLEEQVERARKAAE